MIATQTGEQIGPTQTGLNSRISQGQSGFPSGTFSNHALDDPRIMLVPMVDFSGINGHSEVPVKGFAELWVVGVNAGGDINTYFIEQTSPQTQSYQDALNFGAYAPIVMQ